MIGVLPSTVYAISLEEIKVGTKTLKVEVANTDVSRNQGLMNRSSLAENSGMLFVFPVEQKLSFWMKDTFIPLSIGFFNKNKVLIEVLDMEPVSSVLQTKIPMYKSRQKALYALEVNRSWFKKNKIKIGDKLYLSK